MIGIIGASGNIGTYTAHMLRSNVRLPIKVGARNKERLHVLYSENDYVLETVDASDSQSLQKFFDGCQIVINCSGPSNTITPIFLREVQRRGIHGIDLGTINENNRMKKSKTIAIHSAGMSQGLSGVIQRVAVEGLNRVESFEYSFGGISPYTFSAARDFLDGISGETNRAMSRYESGRMIQCGIQQIKSDGFFKAKTVFYPFIDEESKFIIKHIDIQKGIWCFAAEGVYFNTFIKRARYEAAVDKERAVAQMVEASKKDINDFSEQIKFFIRTQSREFERIITLRTKEQAYLSARVVVTTAMQILKGKIQTGCYPLVCINNPYELYEEICSDSKIITQRYQKDLDTFCSGEI